MLGGANFSDNITTNNIGSNDNISTLETVIFAVSIASLEICSIIINSFLAGLYVYFKRQLLNQPRNCILLSLTLSNLVFSLFVLTSMLVTVSFNRWSMGDGFCEFVGFVGTWWWVVSVFTLTLLSYERYQVILHPLHNFKYIDMFKINLYLGCGYFLGCIISVLPLFGWSRYRYDSATYVCMVEWRQSSSYDHFFLTFIYWIPVIVNGFFYVNITNVAAFHVISIRRQSRVSPTVGEDVLARKIMQLKGSRATSKKAVTTSIIIVGTILICWTPCAVRIYVLAYDGTLSRITSVIVHFFTCVPSVVYPIYFGFRNHSLKRELKLFYNYLACWYKTEEAVPDTIDERDYPENVSRRNSRTESMNGDGYGYPASGNSSRRVSWNFDKNPKSQCDFRIFHVRSLSRSSIASDFLRRSSKDDDFFRRTSKDGESLRRTSKDGDFFRRTSKGEEIARRNAWGDIFRRPSKDHLGRDSTKSTSLESFKSLDISNLPNVAV